MFAAFGTRSSARCERVPVRRAQVLELHDQTPPRRRVAPRRRPSPTSPPSPRVVLGVAARARSRPPRLARAARRRRRECSRRGDSGARRAPATLVRDEERLLAERLQHVEHPRAHWRTCRDRGRCSAASSAKPPRKTAHCASAARSHCASSSHDQSIAPRIVRWRSVAKRAPAREQRRIALSGVRGCSRDSARRCARRRARSRAGGRRGDARCRSSAVCSSPFGVKSGRTFRARSTKSRTASPPVDVDLERRTTCVCSPCTRSASRDVAICNDPRRELRDLARRRATASSDLLAVVQDEQRGAARRDRARDLLDREIFGGASRAAPRSRARRPRARRGDPRASVRSQNHTPPSRDVARRIRDAARETRLAGAGGADERDDAMAARRRGARSARCPRRARRTSSAPARRSCGTPGGRSERALREPNGAMTRRARPRSRGVRSRSRRIARRISASSATGISGRNARGDFGVPTRIAVMIWSTPS